MAEKTTYTKNELTKFKELILSKIESAKDDLEVLRAATANDSDNGTEDTSPTFKQFEEGSALVRIENKTYGICRSTGKLISKERLQLVPHATLSIEAKKAQ